MKYMYKALSVLTLLAVVAGFTACSEDEVTTEVLNSEQVYFPNTLQNIQEVKAEASTVEIPVMRMGTDAVTIPLVVEQAEGNILELNIPDNVVFAADQKETKLVITYNPEKIQSGKYDSVKLSFGDKYNTPYGNSAVSLKIGQAEPWVSLGKGKLTDNWIYENVKEAKVEILQNKLFPNRFRIVKPFNELAKANGSEPKDGFTEFMDITVLKKGDVYKDVTISTDGLVVYNNVNSGFFHSKYNADIYVCHPSGFNKYKASDEGWKNNKVLSYQANELPAQISIAPFFYMKGVGGWDQTTSDSQLVITFPGVVIADYSAEVSYAGKYEASDGAVSIVANVKLGKDVASAKAVVIAGGVVSETSFDASLSNVVDVAEAGDVRIPMPEGASAGVYSIIVQTYNADKVAQKTVSTQFVYSDVNSLKERWKKAFVGDYTYKYVFIGEDGNLSVDENLVLYVSESNNNRYKIENCFLGVDFVFTVNPDDGTITFADQFTGYVDKETGNLYLCDMNALMPKQFPTKSNKKDDQFFFNIGFYTSAGYWGYDQSNNNSNLETFVIKGPAPSGAPAKKDFKRNVLRIKNVKKNVKVRPVAALR